MTNSSKAKGDRAELEAARILHDLLGVPARRAAQRRATRARNREAIRGDEAWHGTTNGYTNHCCRCEPCRTAYRGYVNEWRVRPGVAERRRASARLTSKSPHRKLAVRARTYGITRETLQAMLDRERCDACGTTEPGPHGWAVDHDHLCCPGKTACGRCVRGILCRPCNVVLGQIKDDPEALRRIAAYVERARHASQ